MTVSDLKNRAVPAEAAEPIKTKEPNGLGLDDIKQAKGEKKAEGWFQFKTDLVWSNIFGFGLWHLITFYYLFTFPYLQYKGLMLWAFIMAELNLLSITAGVHRLWCHRSYKAKTPLRIFLAIFFLATGENRISHWVREHRVHHKYVDTDADPHNSKRGLFFSHIGWQMMKKHPDVIKKGRTINYDDMRADPVVVFFDRHFAFFKTLLCFVLPVFIPVYFFGQELKPAIITQWFIRYPYVVNIMFSVNSFAHAVGYRSYDRTIRPTENGVISMVTTGEGWHNYHHAFPWDYKAAELGSFFFNRCTWWINLWAKMGLAYDLKEAGEHSIKRIVERKGDGSHPIWTSREDGTPIEEPEEHPY
ncbi:acyl-CoA Delta(11) desaturase [Diachasma alloeum]|uniref:acyl-CoA Delta(11) desaturase n=1 Tax=Diachasma alloeum TaxID=454923 RepID=UPI0010FAED33|nr:acyl-CoA Delta(11) desaturase [Diachasma alloeum]